VGELLALLSACCFAAANVTIVRGARSRDNGAFLSILMTAAIAGVVWMYGGLRTGWPQVNAVGMIWFAAAGVLTIFIGRVFLFASVQHLGAVQASAVKRLNPFFSVLLGVLVLGEPFDSTMMIGMLLIFSSFGVLLKQSMAPTSRSVTAGNARPTPRSSGSESAAQSWAAKLAGLGVFYGPVSALAYATGYVARKQGLTALPDPAFGTMFGSVVGAIFFVLAARFVDSYRHAVRNALTTFSPWLFAAAVLSSMGQLLYFTALSYSTISRVALISSMEVFVTIFLTVAIFRSREQLNAPVLLAACLGVAGTAFIVLHSG
jgi:drug/metabolite transporter (DMT)-like permease